jgi:hypothetical protein
VNEIRTFDNAGSGKSLGRLLYSGNAGGHQLTICKPKAKNPEIDLQNKVEPDDFVYVARRLECDEDKERFEKKLARLLRWNRVAI